MKSNWDTVELASICMKVCSGGTPSTRNKDFYTNGTIPWVKTKEVLNGNIYEAETLITEDALKGSSAKLIPVNSVIIAMYGNGDTAGRVAINKVPLATNQACCNLIIDPEKADYRFVFYYLRTQYKKLVDLKNGGAQQNLNAGIVKEYPFPDVPLPMQKEIANTLEKFDLKNELNQQTNQTLEQMAQALFKSWFVDFDPVVDNALAAGNPIPEELAHRVEVRKKAKALPDFQPLPEDIRSLFPSEFDQTGEVTFGIGGWIPKGWEYKKFKEVIDKYIDNRGKTPPLSREGYPLVEVKNLPANGNFPLTNSEKRVDEKTFRSWFRQYVREKDILISTVGTIGRSSFVKDVSIGVAQNVLGLRFEKLATPEFMFYTIKGHKFQHDVDSRLVITVQASIKRKDLNTIDILLPNISIQNKFSEIVDGYLTAQYCRALQNQTLEASRDALLPKLISGEIKLQPASKNIQEAELQGV